MKINELVKICERIEQQIVHHAAEYAEDGSVTREAWDETVEVQVPVMDTVCRDATPEEEAEFERQKAELPEPEPTAEERLDKLEPRTYALENTTDDMILLMADLIGGM